MTWMSVVKRVRIGLVVLGCLSFDQLRYSAENVEDEKHEKLQSYTSAGSL